MKVYIAGPMRGYEELNFPAFHEAAATLRAGGHEVVSPAELDLEAFGTMEAIKAEAEKPGMLAGFLKRDLAAMLDCTTVALLPGWEKSQGALTEAMVAAMAGIPLFEYTGSAVGGPGVSIYRMLLMLGEKIVGGRK